MISQYVLINEQYFDLSNMEQLKYIMKSVTDISFYNEFKMNEKHKQMFLGYKFNCLRYLNLNGQDIDDDFMEQLCESDNLKTIRKLDLRNNPKITFESINMLNESENVGCQGHGVIMSGKYGRPITNIEIIFNDAKISNDEMHACQRINWDLTYFDSRDGTTFSCIKTLNIHKYPISQYGDY